MRDALRSIEGKRARFRAVFDRFDSRTSGGYFVPTLLLLAVTDTHGNEVTDHLWFRVGKTWEALELKEGDRVEFEARADSYVKGYHDNRRVDWCLKNPTRVRKLERFSPEIEELPLFAAVA